MIKLVYVAGNYTALSDDPIEAAAEVAANIARANATGKLVTQLSQLLFPVIPHNNTPSDWIDVAQGKYFLEGTLELMRQCAVVLIIPGCDWKNSIGTLGEIAEAEKLGITVCYSLDELAKWLEDVTDSG